MKKIRIMLFAAVAAVIVSGCANHSETVDFVNPYIGNVSHLLVPTFPTVQLPNSLLRVYPERADYTSEYLNGLPVIVTNHRERSAFKLSVTQSADPAPVIPVSYDNEHLTPYGFSVDLEDGAISAEYAVSHQSAVYRLHFNAGKPATVVLCSASGEVRADGGVLDGVQHLDNRTSVYVHMEFEEEPLSSSSLDGRDNCAVLTFSPGIVHMRYGVSLISCEQAAANLHREIGGFDLDSVAAEGRRIWNDVLGRLEVEGADENDLTVFYTSYYRTFERPVCLSEDGRYWSAYDGKVHEDGGVPFYTDDWIWDTYRAAHPLRTVMNPELEEDIIESYLRMAEQMGTGWMPTFPEITGDSRRMNSNHAVASVADAIAKGLDVDITRAYEACRKGITEKTLAPWCGKPAGDLDAFFWMNGFVPALREGETETDPNVHSFEKRQPVAVTLGTSYDCWCLSKLAEAAGDAEGAAYFAEKSLNYRNLFNPQTAFFHPKDSGGAFIEPFDYNFPGGMGAREYYGENNGWVYRWDVQHNIPDLVELMGGPEQFTRNLDQTFATPLGRSKFEFFAKLPDHTGNVGQFSMANEPSLHVPYLYDYAGAAWKTQKRIRQMLRTWFRNDLMGVPGDEDGGGMTSFVVFSSMGIYPVTPGSPVYAIGSPLFGRTVIHLPDGNSFEIVARNVSEDNKYIQSASLNGKALNSPFINHSDIVAGGKLEFIMGDKPNKEWGKCSAGAFNRTESGFKAAAGDCNVQVSCYGPNIVRVEKYPLGTDCPEVKSFAVTKAPGDCRFKVTRRHGKIILKTSQLVVALDLKSSVVKVTDRTGKDLTCEKPGGFCLEPVQDVQADRFRVSQTFVLDENEHIYGLGQHQQGHFDMRGSHVHLENVNMEVAIPIIHSSKGYALFWDNTSVTEFDDSPEGMKFESVVGRKSDYYVIFGGSADGVVAGIRDLTGQVPMMPLWSFGFNQSRERYGSQNEIVGVVERFRELGVPLDGIIQDWQYWSTDFNYWNAVEWGNPEYPDPEAMLEKIHSLNAHCTISVWPSFGPKTNIFKDLEDAGVLMPHSTFPPGYGVRNYDPFKQRASEIYWSYMKKYLFDAGIDGWWLDATEPERQPPILESDLDYETPYGTFRDLRNAYPIATVGGVYDAQRASDSTKRVFILTRSAAAGQQRYGSQVWSGDVVARWDVLAAQIPAAINYSLCGLPYWNLDIGGFFVPGELYPEGNANPEYRRLYLRWMQFGAFTGMMRSHGTSTPREIYNFGEPGSFDFEAQAKFINLRYRLLPYIYSASYQISSASASLMRPLFAEFPDDANVYSIPDEYFFGKSILVAPVSTDDNFRTVYLPEGNWFDFWNGEPVQGGREFTYECALDSMPLFVPAGSIVPVGPTVMYASQKPWDSLQIRIYPGADAEYELYEDAGDGYGYLDGEYSAIRFAWDDKAGKLTVEAREGGFPGMLAERDFNVVLVREGIGTGLDNESCDVTVHYDGSAVTAAIK